MLDIMHGKSIASKHSIDVTHPNQLCKCIRCPSMHNCRSGNYNDLSLIRLDTMHIISYLSNYMERGTFARACAAPELKNIYTFPWPLRRHDPYALLPHNYLISLLYVSDWLANCLLFLSIKHYTLVHHHTFYFDPRSLVDEGLVVRCTVKIIWHDHVCRCFF